MKNSRGGGLEGYRGVRILVTGASGFIGRWVARRLAAAGAELWVAGRNPEKLGEVCEAYEIRARVDAADLSQPGSFARLYDRLRPAVTFNLAGYGVNREEQDPQRAHLLNAQLVAEMAEVIAEDKASDWPGLRLVHVGSAFEYGPVQGRLTEETPPAPVGFYGETKLAGTRHLLAARDRYGLAAVTARLFTVYGPGEHAARLLPSLLRLAQTGETLPLTAGQQRRDFTYVEDVAEGLLRLGRLAEAPGVVNLATGRLTSVREFAECAAELLRLRPDQLQFGALPYRGDEVPQPPVDVSRLEQLLGWRPPRTIREGIRQTIAFVAAQNARVTR